VPVITWRCAISRREGRRLFAICDARRMQWEPSGKRRYRRAAFVNLLEGPLAAGTLAGLEFLYRTRHNASGMHNRRWFLLQLAGAAGASALPSDYTIHPELLRNAWPARWIRAEGTSPFDFGVYHFRRSFSLNAKPERFVIHVSADNRYQLYVNGTRVVWGPARGDLFHWRYETVDIAPWLRDGANVLAAVVWNFGVHAPEAQQTWQTGFLLQSDSAEGKAVDTGPAWKGIRNAAYMPIPYSHAEMRGYFVVGPGERIDGASYPWGWEQPDFDDTEWKPAQAISPGAPRESRDGPNRWMLVPRSIPLMEETPQRIPRLRKVDGISPPAGFPGAGGKLQIPANTRATLLLDQSHLTTGYPELTVSGGRGATVSLGYAEALYQPGGRRGAKGNRDEVEGKEFIGYRDVFTLDGGARRRYRPLWWRTWRYLEVKIETSGEALTIDELTGVYTGYPFVRKAKFDAGDERLTSFLDIGWRTARLCAHETYMDCPYYEQLQYIGDTRIQALVSVYNSGDTRLMRNAIEQMDHTRTPEGATQSRGPTRQQQYIPSFSLWWIGMVHDYWMYVPDPGFVKRMLTGTRAVLGFFEGLQKENGSLGHIPWWRYVDWANEWQGGQPPEEPEGSCAPFDLQLILALDWAAQLEEALGWRALAERYRNNAARLRAAVPGLYWDSGRGLFADTPKRKHYSEQTNVLAILAGVAPDAGPLMRRILEDRTLVRSSYYFLHYLHSALVLAGEGDRYLSLLGDWDAMRKAGLTTWAERQEGATNASRSDCHAWSASPNVHLFRLVAGIDSAAPGFAKVRIAPHLGPLTRLEVAVPHPAGEVMVSYRVEGARLRAKIAMPEGVEGQLLWRGNRKHLRSGTQEIEL
jgi:hypothetical protein